jgi:hypothetical protein
MTDDVQVFDWSKDAPTNSGIYGMSINVRPDLTVFLWSPSNSISVSNLTENMKPTLVRLPENGPIQPIRVIQPLRRSVRLAKRHPK